MMKISARRCARVEELMALCDWPEASLDHTAGNESPGHLSTLLRLTALGMQAVIVAGNTP